MTENHNACDRYPLHKAVFEGNLRKVSSLLRDHDIGEKDIHGRYIIRSVGSKIELTYVNLYRL